MLEGNDVALAIGGPDGHSEAVRKAAAWHWSLSKLTLPASTGTCDADRAALSCHEHQ